ncbi:isochorismatase family protein [Streptomyces poriticola]|uniref:isochorismatase family protein n=1 Tax=Streptomyces poriticola TaxID=3120506 RepID=UPI002FCE5B7B
MAGGACAHIGVPMTACDARMRGVRAFVVADAVADFSEREHRTAPEWAAGRRAFVTATDRVFRPGGQAPRSFRSSAVVGRTPRRSPARPGLLLAVAGPVISRWSGSGPRRAAARDDAALSRAPGPHGPARTAPGRRRCAGGRPRGPWNRGGTGMCCRAATGTHRSRAPLAPRRKDGHVECTGHATARHQRMLGRQLRLQPGTHLPRRGHHGR